MRFHEVQCKLALTLFWWCRIAFYLALFLHALCLSDTRGAVFCAKRKFAEILGNASYTEPCVLQRVRIILEDYCIWILTEAIRFAWPQTFHRTSAAHWAPSIQRNLNQVTTRNDNKCRKLRPGFPAAAHVGNATSDPLPSPSSEARTKVTSEPLKKTRTTPASISRWDILVTRSTPS